MLGFKSILSLRKQAKLDGNVKSEAYFAGILAEKENQRMSYNRKNNPAKYEKDVAEKKAKFVAFKAKQGKKK